jgi:periplasmic copper chaperone A
MTMRLLLVAAAASLLLATAAQAEDSLKIDQPWARATPGGAKNGAAYVTLESAAPDALVAASSPVSAKAEIHMHAQEGGVMKMMPVEEVPLDPGKKVELKPGGEHIMLLGLKRPLKEGEHFPLTLTFRNGGKREVEVRVEKPGAGAPTMGGMKHGG